MQHFLIAGKRINKFCFVHIQKTAAFIAFAFYEGNHVDAAHFFWKGDSLGVGFTLHMGYR